MMDILKTIILYIYSHYIEALIIGIIAGIASGLIVYRILLRRKLRHFERLRKKSFQINDDMSFYKGFAPTLADIGSDRDVIRELHYQLFPQILETKNSPKNCYLSIIAPPQEGKSTMLLRFAKVLVDNKEIVLWADATYKFAQENPFDELKLTRKRRNKRIFAIIDNIARLLRYEEFLKDLARHPEIKVTAIGASRFEDWENVKFEHPLGIEYLFENPGSRPRLPYKLEITKADVESAVKKLLDKGVLKEPKKPLRVPPNFSILIWVLAAPEGEEDFSAKVLEEVDGLPLLEKKAYCYICALHRFGLPMPSPLIKRIIGKDAIGCLEDLGKKGVIRYIDKIDSYISRHEIVAETIFRDFCPQIPFSKLFKFYKTILEKATLKEEVLMVLLFQIHLEKDLRYKLKADLREKYQKTFSKSKSAENQGLGWGIIFGELSCYDLAEGTYRKSLTINEKQPKVHNNYANLLKDLERYKEAEDHYKSSLELKDDLPEPHNNYGLLLYGLKRYAEAENHYKRALELKEDYLKTHYNYAIFLASLKRYREAEVHYKRTLELKEDYLEAHNNYAVFLYKTERYKEAEEHYKRALELNKDSPEVHYNYALLLADLKRYQEAEEHYKRALELKEDLLDAYMNYAYLLEEIKKYPGAEEQYLRALELKENDAAAHNNYANLLVKLERYKEAEEHYKMSLEIEDGCAEPHFNYALFLDKIKKYKEAEVHYKKALELKAYYAKAMVNLGFLYLKEGFRYPEKAMHWLKKAWEYRERLPDKGESVKKALKSLSSEKGKRKDDKSPSNEL